MVTLLDPLYALIRFGTGDLSAITTEPCSCGRTSSRLTGIMGRVDEVTKIKGMFVHPRQVDEVARAFPEVRRYQVVVRLRGHDDEMTLRVELASGVEPEPLLTKLTEKTKDLLKIRAHVEAVPSGTIADNAKKILDERRWN